MGFPATKSSVSQIIEKLDSLPNSARDTAVNNSIVPSDNLAGLGESVLKLYSESSPSAREAIAEMFELACNEPFDNWLDRVERICDGFSKQRECVREFDSLPEAIADALDSEGWTVSDDDVRNLGYLEIERETDLTGYDLVLTIDLRGKDMDSASDWMSAVPAIGCLQSAISSTAGIRSRRRLSPLDARTLPRSIESSKTSNLPMRAQSPVSKLSAKLSPAHGMRKLRRKTSIRNRSTIFANEQALPSMTRWMILARLGAARISISSQRPAGECCSPIAR